jgi:PadR family transcriptional regulator, regulatory protein PadR
MANPFATETELLVLRLLAEEPTGKYGLELVRSSEGKLKRNSVYVTLGRLEEKGFVKSHTPQQAAHAGLPRPVYKLTAQGRRALEAAEILGLCPTGAR